MCQNWLPIGSLLNFVEERWREEGQRDKGIDAHGENRRKTNNNGNTNIEGTEVETYHNYELKHAIVLVSCGDIL